MNAATNRAEPIELVRLQAIARAVGCTLSALPDGAFLITRWKYARQAETLDEVAEFLQRVAPQTRPTAAWVQLTFDF